MTRNVHDEARELIALGNSLSGAQRIWLQAHLLDCVSCGDYRESAGRAVRAFRSRPLAADPALVRATQIRVRSRALELRQRRERMWLVCLSCLFVGLSAAITTPLFWRASERVGEWAGLSSWVWQAGFTFFWMAPALVVSALLLARGTHLAHNGQAQ